MAVGVGKHVVLSSFLLFRYLKKKLDNGETQDQGWSSTSAFYLS